MLQKSILSKPKWGRGTPAVAGGGGYGAPGPTVARTLAISTKNNTPVVNFVNSRKKQQSYTLNQGCKFELKLEKVGCFTELEKTACQQ